jgi:hypothetical protein
MEEKIISRPYNRDGEESYERVFGDKKLPQYMVSDNADTAELAEKEGPK